VYLGDAKAKGNPLAQAVGFLGSSISTPGSTVVDWTAGVVTGTAAGTPSPLPPGAVAPVPGGGPGSPGGTTTAPPPTTSPTTQPNP
ncbi:MAG TPA: hypothetical protein VN891_15575, partial [Steroidobacteraceae bacterium]|nr:hypothetical protein [Steroidobacteraceae bacterium]